MLYYNQIIGHKKIKEHFQMAVQQKKVSHAYILSGEAGTGKTTLANVYAAALQCETEGEEPCGICKSCKQAESGNHPDIIWITHEKKSIGVDVIREQINGGVAIMPYSSPYKIYIMKDAEKMTEQAQNALLKTIEEPPSYAVILLLSENSGSFLPTILSRCVSLDLKPVSQEEITKYLVQQYKVTEHVAHMSAIFAQGNVGRAIRYATSEDFVEMKEEVLNLLRHMEGMKVHEMLDSIRRMKERKAVILDYIDLMTLWYRDVLLFKVTNDSNHLIFKDEYKYISKEASVKSYPKLEEIIQSMGKAKIRLNANVSFEVVIELMLLTLKDN